MKKSIGIDIGGTKIAAGIVTQSGSLLKRVEVKSDPTDREKMFSRVIEAVGHLLEVSDISMEEIEGIGVGVPGKVDCENGIAVFQNNLPWKGFQLTARLLEHYGSKRVTIDNDVYMAAYAEWKNSLPKENETFVYVTISTGIASAIIHKGAFLRGAGFAGEVGLIPVLSEASNHQNIRLESVAAGPSIQKIAQSTLQTEILSTKDVFTRYKNGDLECKHIIEEVANNLAQGLYSTSCILDPHRMVFGGSVIVNNPSLLDLIKEKLRNYQLPEQQHVLDQMSISTLRQDNGVIGAGLRVFENI